MWEDGQGMMLDCIARRGPIRNKIEAVRKEGRMQGAEGMEQRNEREGGNEKKRDAP